MSTNPTRRPAGTPTGGQFAPETHAEPEVTLGAPPPEPESTPETRGNGDILWYNADGQLHRTDGPAVELAEGDRQWWVNGQLHRTDGPAVDAADGHRAWFVNGHLHRTGGPAVEFTDGTRKWHVGGQIHRTDGPAVEFADGRRQWWVDGEQLTEEEFYGRAVLHQPLTPDQIRARMDDDGYVAGLVPMDLDDTTDGLESTLDTLSERLVGSGLLMDIDYRPVAVTRDGTIIVRVAGDPSMVLSDADD